MFRVRRLLLVLIVFGLPLILTARCGWSEDKTTDSKKKAKPIDLLKMIDPVRHSIGGKWAFQKLVLISDSEGVCKLMIPYQPPAEYDLEIVARRLRGKDGIGISVPIEKSQPCVMLDGFAMTVSGISRVDSKPFDQNDTASNQRVFPDAGDATVVCRVRQNAIEVTTDGKTIIEWKGDSKRLSFHTDLEVPNKTVLALGTWHTSFAISKLTLTPVTGEGKKLK